MPMWLAPVNDLVALEPGMFDSLQYGDSDVQGICQQDDGRHDQQHATLIDWKARLATVRRYWD